MKSHLNRSLVVRSFAALKIWVVENANSTKEARTVHTKIEKKKVPLFTRRNLKIAPKKRRRSKMGRSNPLCVKMSCRERMS